MLTLQTVDRRSVRVRAWLVIVPVVLLVVLELAVVVIFGLRAQNNLLTFGKQSIDRVGDRSVDSTRVYLQPAELATTVTAEMIHGNVIALQPTAMERYLLAQLQATPQVAGMYVGLADGSFVYLSRLADGYRSKLITFDAQGARLEQIRSFDSDLHVQGSAEDRVDTFDPRTRPWYDKASQAQTLVWTDPYVFFTARKPGVTAAQAVRRDGNVVAVVGVDIELTGLSTFLDELSNKEGGEAFLLSGTGAVVAMPSSYGDKGIVQENDKLRLPTLAELDPSLAGAVHGLSNRASDDVTAVNDGGRNDLVLVRDFPTESATPWKIVIRASQDEFTRGIRHDQRVVLWVLAGVGVAVLAAAIPILLRVTRPVVQLRRHALEDHLTGIGNRRDFVDRARRILAADEEVAVALIDLDGFKSVNDQLGHDAGDRLLTTVAARLEGLIRKNDVLARLGGDEFGIVFRESSAAMAAARLESARASISAELRSVHIGGPRVDFTVGISASNGRARSIEELLGEADTALRHGKQTGKGQVSQHDESGPTIRQHVTPDGELIVG
jgi:diguanylate cyclase (GGDEF)-like protein